MDREVMFPLELIERPILPQEWNPEEEAGEINRLSSIAKPAVANIVVRFWIAHEKLVNKNKGEFPDWTWTRFCKETGWAPNTPYNWFGSAGLEYTKTSKGGLIKNFIKDKPLKKLTKSDTKFKLEEVKEEIKADAISDSDLKEVFDVVAQKIDEDKIAPRVVSKVETSVRKYHARRKRTPEKTKASRVELLDRKLGDCSEELKLLVDGQIEMSSGDQKYVNAIQGHAPSMIWSFHDLGVDIQKVWRMIIGRKEIQDETRGTGISKTKDQVDIQSKDIIEVEAKVIS
jgi:hypothetical protein